MTIRVGTPMIRHPGESRDLGPLQARRFSPAEVPASAGMTTVSTTVIA
jgi:hypothetical protein